MRASPSRFPARQMFWILAISLLGIRANAYNDNFERRNNKNLGSPWVESEGAPPCDSALSISANQVLTSQCSGGFAYWNAPLGGDQYSRLKYASQSRANRDRPLGGPAIRIQSFSSWNNASLYTAEYDRAAGVIRLWRYQNQSLSAPGTQLGADVSATLNVDDWLEIRAQGTTVEVLKNSTIIISITDTAFASGGAGIAVRGLSQQSGSLGWANWEGGSGPLCNQDTNLHAPVDYSSYLPPPKGSLVDGAHSTYCTAIKRLTDGVAPAGVPKPNFVHAEYSTQNHFNAATSDADTRILVEAGPASGIWLIDLNGNVLKTYSDLQASAEPMWDRANKFKFYFHPIGGNQIKRRDVVTDATETIATFSEYVSIAGRGESDLSPDGSKMVLMGQKADETKEVFVYDLSTLTKSPALQLLSSDQVDWLQVTNHFAVIGYLSFHGGNAAARLYDTNMAFQRQLANFIGHEDVGLDSNGDEILVISGSNASSPSPCPGGGNCIIKYKLEDGTFKALPAVDWSLAEHIAVPSLPVTPSAWVYVSTYAPSNPDPLSADWKPYTNEVVRFRLDGTGVERLAHHYSRPGGETYNWTPRSNINANGTRVLFNSNFGMQSKISPAPDPTYTDVYLITLP